MGQNSCQPEGLRPQSALTLSVGCSYSRYELRRPSRHPQFWLATHTCFIMLGTLKPATAKAQRKTIYQDFFAYLCVFAPLRCSLNDVFRRESSGEREFGTGFQAVETRNLEFETDLVPLPHFIAQRSDGERGFQQPLGIDHEAEPAALRRGL